MKQKKWLFLTLGFSFFCFFLASFPSLTLSNSPKPMPPFFKPKKGVTVRRPGTTTRGPGGLVYPNISTLAPAGLGYTTKENPNLYWFLSAPWKGKIVFALNDFESMETVLEIELSNKKAGIFAVSLKENKVKLIEGVEYEWYVSLVPDEKNRSADIVSSATVTRISPSKTLSKKLETGKENAYLLYAQEGIWYDTIALLSGAIAKQKENRELRDIRAQFLDQVQLPHIAKFDRKE